MRTPLIRTHVHHLSDTMNMRCINARAFRPHVPPTLAIKYRGIIESLKMKWNEMKWNEKRKRLSFIEKRVEKPNRIDPQIRKINYWKCHGASSGVLLFIAVTRLIHYNRRRQFTIVDCDKSPRWFTVIKIYISLAYLRLKDNLTAKSAMHAY